MKYYNYPDPRGTEVAENVDSINVSQYGGGGGEAFIVTPAQSGTSMVCDKTYKEIKNAMLAGKSVIFIISFDNVTVTSPVVICGDLADGKFVYVVAGDVPLVFTCSTENDYPTMEGEG